MTDSTKDDTCPVCMDEIENRSSTDTCNHVFCYACIDRWSEEKSQCPMCRREFSSIRSHESGIENVKCGSNRKTSDVDVDRLTLELGTLVSWTSANLARAELLRQNIRELSLRSVSLSSRFAELLDEGRGSTTAATNVEALRRSIDFCRDVEGVSAWYENQVSLSVESFRNDLAEFRLRSEQVRRPESAAALEEVANLVRSKMESFSTSSTQLSSAKIHYHFLRTQISDIESELSSMRSD